MSDDNDKKPAGDFELDWDDALADWEKDVESGSATAKAAPMPQKPAAPAAPSRALYQPPDASEIARMRGGRGAPAPAPAPAKPPLPTKPPPPGAGTPLGADVFDLDDDEDGSTKIAIIPKDLIEKITGGKPAIAPPPPAPAPLPPVEPPARTSAVDLDIDGLLDGLDSETRHYPAEPPRVQRPLAVQPVIQSVKAAAAASVPTPPPSAPAEPAKDADRLSLEDLADGLDDISAGLAAASSTATPVPPAPAVASPTPIPSAPSVPSTDGPSKTGLNAATELARAVARAAPQRPPVAVRPPPPVPRPGMPAAPSPPRVPPPGAPRVPSPVRVPVPAAVAPATVPPQAEEDLDVLLSGLDLPDDEVTRAVGGGGDPLSARERSEVSESSAEHAFFAEKAAPVAATRSSIVDELRDLALDDEDSEATVARVIELPPEAAPAAKAPPVASAAAPTPAVPSLRGEGGRPSIADRLRALAPKRELDATREVSLAAGLDPAAPMAAPVVAAPIVAERPASIPPPLPARTTARPPASDDDEELTVAVSAADDDAEVSFVDEDDASDGAASENDDDTSAEAGSTETVIEAEEPSASEPAADAVAAPSTESVRPEVTPAKRVESDRGAQAARRSVRSRKPRKEHFPLIGLDADARRAQLELLLRLVDASKGAARARLCLAASELAYALGDSARGGELRDQARAADPKEPLALRSVRRAAQARSAWPEVRSLLKAESELSFSDGHRALTLATLAELELGPLRDAAAAASTAVRALTASPSSTAAALTLHDALVVRAPESPTARAQGLAALARATSDDRVARIFSGEHLRAGERAGFAPLTELESAPELAALDPDGLLARARIFPKEAALPLAALAPHLAPSDLADLVRRRAAISAARSGDDARALETIGAPEDASLPSLRTMTRLAARTGDRPRELSSLRALAALSSGTERAAALARAAQMHVDDGELDLADVALRDAALADASLGALRVVRQSIARKDPTRVSRTESNEGALVLAARLAPDVAESEREAELFERARAEEDAPVTADVLSLDAALGAEARTSASSAVLEGIVRQIERTPADIRTSGLLLLADRHARAGNSELAESALRDARALSPGNPLVVRPLAALVRHRSAQDAAAFWLEEASAAPEARAASAASIAGRMLEGEEAVQAHRRALDVHRGHAPSIAELERLARLAADAKLLEEALERGAEIAANDGERAAQLVRLALVRAGEDPAAAASTFESARALVPDDAVLVDLAMRLGDGLTPAIRASLTERAAARAPSGLSSAYRLAHATALEDAGEPAAAAEMLRGLVASDDAFVRLAATRALDRAEIAAGDHARVAERRFASLRSATDALEALSDAERSTEAGARAVDAHVRALEALASLDLDVRGDAAAAAASLTGILEARPKHLGALRSLERYLMDADRAADLTPIEEGLSLAVPDPTDARAHLRLATRLRLSIEGSGGASADSVVLAAAERVRRDVWTLRRVVAAASASGDRDRATEAAVELAEALAGASERASVAREASRTPESDPIVKARLAALMGPFADAAPSHPILWDVLAEVRIAAGENTRAIDALEAAGHASAVPARKVAFFHRAAVLAEDNEDDENRALALLEQAAKVDVAYADVFERSRVILERRGDRTKLSELVAQRAAAGGDGSMLVDLHVVNATLREGEGDSEGAKTALRAALAIAPEKIEALRKLAQLSLADEDYRSAADALIRIARIRKDREELRWVFFTLGDIYDRHIPDPKRAEAAFLRVLKLEPEDLPSMERLAALYQASQQLPQAAEQLERLAKAEVDPDRARKHQLTLARVLEDVGDPRKAEQVLEAARRAAPTELETLRALADFYGRQRAQTALAMHLNRAVADFRHGLVTDLSDAPVWLGLVEVLGWRGKKDAARAAASAAMALGIVDMDLSRLVDASGAAPGAGARGADPELDDLFSPPNLTAPTRAVFRLLGPALEKVLPFDPRALRAEKLGPKDTSLRPLALDIGRALGLAEVEIWLAPTAGRVCMPVSSQPVAIVVGRDLLAAEEAERAFLLARALRVAKSQLTLAMRTPAAELAALLAGLVLNFDPHFAPPGVDPAAAQDFMKRTARQLPRRAAEEIGPVVFEMCGGQEYDPTRLPLAVSEYADRSALLMTGNTPAALSALLKLAGEGKLPPDPAARAALVRRSPEAASLLAFAISDGYFEARQRAGLDRG